MANKNEDVLTGLKEIGEYLDIHWRTVPRWEVDHGLPLMRPAGSSRVYAYKSDLEKWRRGELRSEGCKTPG